MPRRLAIAVIALTLAGCGQASSGDTGDFTGEEGRVAAVVGELSSAATSSDEAIVCSDLLSDGLVESIAGAEETCTGEVEKAFRDADGFLIDVEDVTVEGEEATAEVKSQQVGEDVTRTFSLVREDDEWRIDSFG